MADLAFLAPGIASDAKAIGPETGEGGEAFGPRRLEPDEGAEGFEHRGFALGVGPDQDYSRRRTLNGQRLKTAEVLQPERVEHAPVVA